MENGDGRFGEVLYYFRCKHQDTILSLAVLSVYHEVFTLPLVFRLESHLNPGIPQDSSRNLTFRWIVDGILPEWCFIYYVLLVRIESHSIP